MSDHDFGRLIYLVLLGSVIAGYFLIANRDRMGETMRQAALWGLIFLGTIVSYGLWTDISDTVLPRQSVMDDTGRVEAPRNQDGHFYLTLHVGEVPIDFVVDTGATGIVLTEQDARRIGIDLDSLIFNGRASTANGDVRTARVRLEDVRIDDYREGRLIAWVNEGVLDTSLLGMDYLQRFDRVEIRGDRLILER